MNLSYKNIDKNKPKVIIALSYDYANVGDIAIYIAQEKIIKLFFPNRIIVEIPMIDYYKYIEELKEIVNDNDIITIIGGGNMGSVYIAAEERRRNLIESFPNNMIISFPQTVDYSYSGGDDELEMFSKIYKSISYIKYFFREKRSYDFMKKYLNEEDCFLVPDTVLYLCEKIDIPNDINRKDLLLCFRDDKEKIVENNIKEKFISLFNQHNMFDINTIDTYLGDITFEPEERKKLFYDVLLNFYNSKVAITDRLHGMIFAFITKTPCIAFDNSTHKISSTYHTWMENVPYIKLVDKYDESLILNYIEEFSKLDLTNIKLDYTKDFKPLFDELDRLRSLNNE